MAGFQEQGITNAESMSLAEFNAKLQQCASESLAPKVLGYVRDWTSHAFRRGGTVDVLQSKGTVAMMAHGEWAAESSAGAYASIDEIDSEKLRAACQSMIDLSDDD